MEHPEGRFRVTHIEPTIADAEQAAFRYHQANEALQRILKEMHEQD